MFYWNKKNVFITGATGLLGSHLLQLLLAEGAKIFVLVRNNLNEQKRRYFDIFRKEVVVIDGSMETCDFLKTLVDYNVDTVFHLASQTIVGVANSNPIQTFEINIKGTWDILEACRLAPCVKKVIVASSDKAYGEQEHMPYIEDMALRGNHPYDVSKSCSDLLAYTYYNTYGLPICITRCGNFYGAGDLNYNRIVPGTISSILNNEAPIIRGDGSSTRDYIYIKDAALAYKHLAEKMDDSTIHGESFNFSYGIQITTLELVKKILALMGKSTIKPIILNQAKNEIPCQYLCSQKAKKTLEWKAQYTLEDSLFETIAWYQDWLRMDHNDV